MVTRRVLTVAAVQLGAVLAIGPLLGVGVSAQQGRGTARVGLLASSSIDRDRMRLEAFRKGLHEAGWIAGRNISIDQRFADGHFEKLPVLAGELVRLNPDVLVAAGAPAAHAAKNATRAIPIVIANAADPVGTGLVASLARPGGNVTGLSDFNAGVVVKRLEILKEMVPSAVRVAVLLNPGNPTNPLQLKLLQEAAPTLGVRLLAVEVRRAEDITRAFVTMKKDLPEAVMVLGDALLGSQGRSIQDLAIRHRLPTTYGARELTDVGGLMSYGPSFEELFRRAAIYVDKILKGARPADLPIEQPTKFELIVNVATARSIGLTIPPSVLRRADHVIG